MELIKPGTSIDFVRYRFIAVTGSIIINVISLLVLLLHGPNYGIDFVGGVMVHLRFHQATPINDLRSALGAELGESAIQDFGTGGTEFLVRLPVGAAETKGLSDDLTNSLQQKFGKDAFEVLRVEVVGPRVGQELRQRAILAVLFSTVMMGAYIWLRFELRFGIGAAVSLFHDVMVVALFLLIGNFEFDLSIVAGLLTIVGFSVNDTVIVSDRIRENMRKSRRESLASIINRSINETLSRTILTTGTAVVVVLALFLLGGNVLRGFSFTLLIGFIVGTYSSIYIAAPIVLYMERLPTAAARARK